MEINVTIVVLVFDAATYLHAAVLQHELEIAVADREHQIPSDRPQDHLSIELPTFERAWFST
jgi:hypothetical protein